MIQDLQLKQEIFANKTVLDQVNSKKTDCFLTCRQTKTKLSERNIEDSPNYNLTFFILIDYPIHIEASISMELSILFKISIKWCISVADDCFYLMQHFIWVFTVCQSTCLLKRDNQPFIMSKSSKLQTSNMISEIVW